MERKHFRFENHRTWSEFWAREYVPWVTTMRAMMVVTGNSEALLREIER
jgi:hypothetical protein